MEFGDFVQTRRARYMAQTLGAFEATIAPLLPAGSEDVVEAFKGTVRQKFNAIAMDATEGIRPHETPHINGFAVELADRPQHEE